MHRSNVGVALLAPWFVAACLSASGQSSGRQTVDVGGLGQTTKNLESGPYQIVFGPDSETVQGQFHEQIFGGPKMGYSFALAPSLAVRADVGYLFGHQPSANQSGGTEVLAHAGLQTGVPVKKLALFGYIEPGISSFSDAVRLFDASGARQHSRVTQFSLQEGVGLAYPVGGRDSIRLDLSWQTLVEGDVRKAVNQSVTTFLPGGAEDHLLVGLAVAHSFGELRQQDAIVRSGSGMSTPKNEIVSAWAVQPQEHLQFENLSVDHGLSITGSHFFTGWMAVDGSLLVFPGGDVPYYQDGGTETEAFVGIRAGVHRQRYGFYFTVRPGIANFSKTYSDERTNPPPYQRATDFAANYGGVIEVYAAKHLVLRVDVGEVLTTYSAVSVKVNAIQTLVQPSEQLTSPLFTVGAGWRF